MLVSNIPTMTALLTLPVRVVFTAGWRKDVLSGFRNCRGLGEVPGSLSVL